MPDTKVRRPTKEEAEQIVRERMAEAGLAPGQVSPLRAGAEEPPLDPAGVDAEEGTEEAELADEKFDAQALMEEVFAELRAGVPEATTNTEEPPAPARFQPRRRDMVRIDGGEYLNVRRRIMWLRGVPEEHPDWGIRTTIIQFEPGVFQGLKPLGRKKVPDIQGGLAIVRAEVVRPIDNENEDVIATGMATERSELFPDFLEKAETAAIGRALAVAGYGTESALELDEGVDDGNIVDAPVRPDPAAGWGDATNAPIQITPSSVEGVRQGGRQTKATQAQITHIRARARDLNLAPTALARVINAAVSGGVPIEEIDDSADSANLILGYLMDLPFEECGKIIQVLDAAVAGAADG